MGSIDTLREKYSTQADPDEPETVTGTKVGESSLDELRRKYNLGVSDNTNDDLQQIPGHETERGSFVPELGTVYKNQDISSIPQGERRRAVGSALRESIQSEELLRKHGFDVPAIGQEDQPQGALRYLKMPLAALKQLQRGQFAVVGGVEGLVQKDPSAAVRNFYRGLVFAEEHSTADLIERYHLLENSPFTKFLATVSGDIVADPLTWFSFGLGGIAKAKLFAKGIKSAEKVSPLLSDFGRATLKEASQVVNEDVAVNAVIEEIRKGTKIGKQMIPAGVTFAHWVPKIGGQRPGDVFRFTSLAPGGVLQKVDDLIASQETMDQLTDVVVSSKIVEWFGNAFIPYWELRRKYPFLIELDRELIANNHEISAKAIARGKALINTVVNEEDRKLITELLEKPELITGRKLALVNRTDPAVPEVKINMDYWPTGTKFSEDQAREMVDFFLDSVKHLPDTVLGETKLGIPSGIGAVYGGEKFEPLRPVFEALKAGNPEAKAFKLHFGDWVIKVPIPGGITTNPVNPVNYGSIKDAAAEMYSASKLGNSGYIPETITVWKRVKELVPESQTSGIDVSYGAMNSNRFGKPVAWAQALGHWDEYAKLNPDPKTRQYATISDFVNDWLQHQTFKTQDLFLPVLVKRFVKGETANHWFNKTVLDYANRRTAGRVFSGEGLGLAKRYEALVNLAKGVAKTGVSMHDTHAENLMFSEAGRAVWVDNARFIDHARGLDSTVVGNFPDMVGTLGSTDSVTAFGVETRKWSPVRIKAFAKIRKTIPEELPERYPNPVPGTPAFDALYPAVESFSPDSAEFAALKTAYHDALNISLENMRGFARQDFVENTLPMQQIHLLVAGLPKEEKLKFVEYLKEAGIVKNYNFTGNRLSIKFSEAADIAFEPIEKLLKPGKPQREWVEQIETLVAKHPSLINAAPERQNHILKTYNMARAWKNELENTLLADGLIDLERMEAFKVKFNLNHIPHIKDANNPLQLFALLNKALKNREKIGSLKKRDIEGTIAAINKEFGTSFFEDDIAVVLTKHAIDVGLAGNARKFIEETAKLYGKPAGMVNAKNASGRTVSRKVADAGWSLLDHPALEGIQLPEEVARSITKYTRTFNNPDKAGRMFWKGYSKVLDLWKGYATFVNPGFHGRNAASNMWQLYIKDGPEAFNPVHHREAINILRGKTGELVTQSGMKLSYEEAMEMAKRYGVYGTGWFGADIKTAEDVKSLLFGVQKIPSKGLNPASQSNMLFQAGRAVGGYVENEFRMVGFLIDLKRTDNPLFAATNTKKHMFDYSEITQFDKGMKMAFPFWTWFKKNIALQAENIIKQPAKYGNIERIKEAMERASPDVDERWLPNYFPEIYASKTPFTTKEGHVLYVNPNLPFQDLNKVFDPKDWISSLAPWKTIFELGTNKSLFNLRDIQKYKGEVVNTPWLDIVPPDLMVKVGPIIGATKAYDPEQKRWFWGLNPKVKYAIEQANPFFRNFGKTVQTIAGQTPEYAREKAPYDVMSWMTGNKLIPYNPTKEMENVILKRRDYLRDQRRAMVQQGKLPSKYLPPTH